MFHLNHVGYKVESEKLQAIRKSFHLNHVGYKGTNKMKLIDFYNGFI